MKIGNIGHPHSDGTQQLSWHENIQRIGICISQRNLWNRIYCMY